ncbi:MAG: hypothetical protein KME35_23165 [Aphanocapsa sp. GSE-SYN-MK-11-07L]|jgi:hypothetical protein|nr:hypothetical protein [Aphanocapsa sp. GSE-SYN-MK-11-07L]
MRFPQAFHRFGSTFPQPDKSFPQFFDSFPQAITSGSRLETFLGIMGDFWSFVNLCNEKTLKVLVFRSIIRRAIAHIGGE